MIILSRFFSIWNSDSCIECLKSLRIGCQTLGFCPTCCQKMQFLQFFKMFQNFPKWVLELFCVRFGNKWCATLSSVVSQGDPERASCRVKIVISTAVLPTSGHNSESKNPRRRRVLRTHPRRFSSGRSKYLSIQKNAFEVKTRWLSYSNFCVFGCHHATFPGAR